MVDADKPVLPNPGIPKTLGILNVVFGSILTLVGLCGVGSFVIGPLVINAAERIVQEKQAKVESGHRASIKALEEQEAAAKDDKQKATLKANRDALIANPPKEPNLGLDVYRQSLENPTVRNYALIEGGTGIVLHILSIVSGIGLIRFRPWARSLALWLAGIHLARLAALLALNLILVLPISTELGKKQIDNQERAAKEANAPPNAMMILQMSRAMLELAPSISVGTTVAMAVYPVILLVLLNRPAARAAFRPSKPGSPGDL